MIFLCRFIVVLSACAISAAPASAHPGDELLPGFVSGIEHPFSGPDHLLAMFAVGLLAVQLGGRSLWLVPSAFVLTMIAGSFAGFAGIAMPGSEFAITLSIVAIGLPVALALGMPVPLAMVWVALFAFFHGFAHGAELPAGGDRLTYIAGFALATAVIHASGIAAGLYAGRLADQARGNALRLAGGAVTLAGIALLVV